MNVIPMRRKDLSDDREIPGLVAVRVVAMAGVLLLHATIPYLEHPMPGLAWPVTDGSSTIVDFAGWSVELFVMPVFLVIAGFLAWQTQFRNGPRAMVRGRLKRLGRPFLFGMIVLLPISAHIWVLGWVTEGHVPLLKLRSFKFDNGIDRDLWGTSHLWFLLYLLTYVFLLAAATRFSERLGRLRLRRPSAGLSIGLLLTACAVIVAVRPEVVWGFQHAFAPVPSKWLYCGSFFWIGVLLARHDPGLSRLGAIGKRWVSPTVMLAIAAVILGRWHLSGG